MDTSIPESFLEELRRNVDEADFFYLCESISSGGLDFDEQMDLVQTLHICLAAYRTGFQQDPIEGLPSLYSQFMDSYSLLELYLADAGCGIPLDDPLVGYSVDQLFFALAIQAIRDAKRFLAHDNLRDKSNVCFYALEAAVCEMAVARHAYARARAHRLAWSNR